MQNFQNKVAVVTGGASGIGWALAKQCAQEGMKIVLADVEAAPLEKAAAELNADDVEVLPVLTDVSKAEAVAELAQQTLDRFGAVHLLFNNAGVGAGGKIWETTLHDWEWTLNVNLWGVIHGIRIFTPIMLAQGDECHIVNTASIAGLIAGPGLGSYKVTKHAVVSLSETLHYELKEQEAKIKVSVLCPEFVNTRIWESERNRPKALRNPRRALSAQEKSDLEGMRSVVSNGISAEEVARHVFEAIRSEKLYVLTHPHTKEWVQKRMEKILA